ncbi:CBO0543 family protein [Paenibacillus mucilaginosus]|uniref:CBO0543 family protein n=1 Tax=Paenibacillus mucilaginosus TaxID=61624 RepID=UPI003B984A9C
MQLEVVVLVEKKNELTFLHCLLLLSMLILPFLMRRPDKKDWLLAYVFNAVTNVLLDKITTKMKLITYPTRLLPKIFRIHILFDLVLYPIATVIYNQMSNKGKDNLLSIVSKVFFFSVPLTLFEIWDDRKTGLIKWSAWWKWYHTLFSVSLKSLITRGLVELYRRRRRSKPNPVIT